MSILLHTKCVDKHTGCSNSLQFIGGALVLFVRKAASSGKVSKENLLLVSVKVAMVTMYSIQGACSIVRSFEAVRYYMYIFSLFLFFMKAYAV